MLTFPYYFPFHHNRGSTRIFILLALLPHLIHAQEPSRLSLEDSIESALRSNLGLKIEQFDTLNAADDIEIENADFDPEIFASAQTGQTSQKTPQSDSNSRSYSTGIRKKIRMTGATLSASTNLSRRNGSSYSNPEETANLTLAITQPLLRNFGSEITNAALNRSRSSFRLAELSFRDQLHSLIGQTENAYWDLAYAYAQRTLSDSSYELAQQLLDETNEKYELGIVTQLEVLQAEANLASRKDEIITTEQLIADQADQLLTLMGNFELETLDQPIPVVSALPTPSAQKPSFPDAWQRTLDNNLSAAQKEQAIVTSEINQLLAKNEARPQLDLELSGSYIGRSSENAKEAYDDAFGRDGDDWNVALTFNFPIGNRSNKIKVRQAQREVEQTEWELIQLKQELLRSLRSNLRTLDTSRERITAAKLLLELQEQSFVRERSRFEEGLSSFRNILEAQRDLDDARKRFLDTQLNAIKAEITLEQTQGTLLERHHLEWDALDPLTP